MTIRDFNGKESSRRATVVTLSGLLLALLIGFWLGGVLGPDTEKSAQPPIVTSSSPEEINGVLLGYDRTRKGAVAAATNFGEVMASVTTDEVSYRDAIRTIAAPQWISEAEKLADNSLRFLKQRYGLGGSFSFVPAKYRVSSYSDHAATVQVWGVTLASGPKIEGLEETWLTGTVDLEWVSGDWRVAGQDSVTGPTPELLHADDNRQGNALIGFENYQHAPLP
jgi:hypothetical protein